MSAVAPPPVLWVPYGEDVLDATAQWLCREQAGELPFLQHWVVLLADLQFAPRLRDALEHRAREQGHGALLGPVVDTFPQWLARNIPLPVPVLSRPAQELVLVEALKSHGGLLGEEDPWRLGDHLLELFAELTLHRIPLETSLEAFQARLQRAYGIPGEAPASLSDEAQILHRLWGAWHSQLAAEGALDPAAAHLQRLQQGLGDLSGQTRLVLVGTQDLSEPELQWCARRAEEGRLLWVLQGDPDERTYHPGAPAQRIMEHLDLPPPTWEGLPALTECLNRAFDYGDKTLPARAATQRRRCPQSPLQGRICLLECVHAEQEARAVSLQVRRWALQGAKRIGVVTEDRRLARRARALLERAGIDLDDSGGWALSTTSAAAVVERWFESVEEDFDHRPLLDVLKSPFLFDEDQGEAHLAAVYRFEQDIVRHEQIARGMRRYRSHLEYRMERLEHWPASAADALRGLLDRVEHAAEPLAHLPGERARPGGQLLERVRESLQRLGLWDRLERDAAGQRVVQEWTALHGAASNSRLTLTWSDFRTWFGRTLERYNFRPAGNHGAVQLLSLRQAQLGEFDALVVAGCDRRHLPGRGGGGAFFNERVRAELRLPTRAQRLAQEWHALRTLLERSPQILLSYHREENGEPLLPSPWLELLRTFHTLAYADGLRDPDLEVLLAQGGTDVEPPEPVYPLGPMTHPAPRLPGELRPRTLSASAHQRLLDCPYRFFAADGLGLQPSEEIKEALAKSDYGERVHQCLEAFHGGIARLPGPLGAPLTAQNREQAIALLEQITAAVFARDLEDNFQHRAWLERWRRLIPAYVDWQMEREQAWRVTAVEQRGERDLDTDLRLKGRLDRIDRGASGQAVIDYKTGTAPSQEAVDAGEAVQLPCYALLGEQPVERVEYLLLDRERVRTGARLEGEALHRQTREVAQRLIELVEAMDQGSPLPAWGDPDTCRYCELDGVCRRQAWGDDPNRGGA